jgi:hypothetical protein
MTGSRPSALRQRIMRLLAGGKPWRSKHVIDRAAKGERPGAVRYELAKLCEEGRISRVGWGVWLLAGKPTPNQRDIPPLRSERLGGPTGRKVFARLGVPISAPTLVAELGVSRQRIDQILKLLQQQGKVTRVREPGAARGWFWIRSDVNPNTFLRHHVPPLTAGQARVLNLLEPGAFHWLSDVVGGASQSSASAAKNIRVLEARGFVVTGWLGQRRIVGITRRGIEHPSSEPTHAHCPVADLAKALGVKR